MERPPARHAMGGYAVQESSAHAFFKRSFAWRQGVAPSLTSHESDPQAKDPTKTFRQIASPMA